MKLLKKNFILLFILGLIIACSSNSTETPFQDSETATTPPTTTYTPSEINTDTPAPTLTRTLPPNKIIKDDQLIKVLFIGNSYTFYNDLPSVFQKLMEAGGYTVEVDQSTFGGWSLSNHTTASETTSMFANTAWDYVILQEHSVVTNPETGMYPAVRELNDLVQSVGAQSILFMTWGRRDGLENAGYPDYESMQSQITQTYDTIAEELDLTVAPVGLIWQNVLAEYPHIQLWDLDGSHPSKVGSYLAAGVFYAVLTGESPEGLDYLAGLSEEDAGIINHIISESVLDNSINKMLTTNKIPQVDPTFTPSPTATPTP